MISVCVLCATYAGQRVKGQKLLSKIRHLTSRSVIGGATSESPAAKFNVKKQHMLNAQTSDYISAMWGGGLCLLQGHLQHAL